MFTFVTSASQSEKSTSLRYHVGLVGLRARLLHSRAILEPGVRGRDGGARCGLDPDLVQADRQTARADRRLAGAVEGVVERLVGTRQVRDTERRASGIAGLEGQALRDRVRVQVDPVHQRLRPPARAVPGAEELEPVDRVRRARARLVGRDRVSPRREAEAPDEDRWIDDLQRVVRGREEDPAACRGDVLAAHVLRVHEEARVALVHDHELPHLGVGDREACNPLREPCRVERARERGRVARIDIEGDVDSRCAAPRAPARADPPRRPRTRSPSSRPSAASSCPSSFRPRARSSRTARRHARTCRRRR